MRHSIRFRMTLATILTVTAAIFLCWVINKTFLEDYYQNSKLKTLDSVYNEINRIINDHITTISNSSEGKDIQDEYQNNLSNPSFSLSNDAMLAIDRVTMDKNIKVCIFPKNMKTNEYDASFYYSNWGKTDPIRIYKTILFYKYDYRLLGSETELLKSKNNYYIFKMYENEDIFGLFAMESKEGNSCYIDLVGELEAEALIILRTNFESIQESVNIANKFLSYVGVATVLIGAVVMFIISRSFTKPILEMSTISKKMIDLDFEAKYEGKRKDEIGELGNSMNLLSKKLESTITELKSANNELQTDIANKVQIDEMRKEFLSNVTHELKTPIALIQGYAEGLQENINDDQESRELYCEVIIDEAAKMNNMVKKLLSLNQIEFGTNNVEIERFDIVALIQSVINSFDILIKQKEVTIRFEESEPVFVWADEYKIEEVVVNYVSNALNHVCKANIIEIKLIHRKDLVRVAVFNTGELIPEEDLSKVWIKFFKVDKARTREYGGSGIGLSIVKAIMDSHNQNYGAVNHINGVEFWFELDAHA